MGLYYLLGFTVPNFYSELSINFISPIAQLVPSCATAAALIYVGILMMASVKNIDWDNFKVSVPAFLTLAVMPFTYNISYGIAFLFIAMLLLTH